MRGWEGKTGSLVGCEEKSRNWKGAKKDHHWHLSVPQRKPSSPQTRQEAPFSPASSQSSVPSGSGQQPGSGKAAGRAAGAHGPVRAAPATSPPAPPLPGHTGPWRARWGQIKEGFMLPCPHQKTPTRGTCVSDCNYQPSDLLLRWRRRAGGTPLMRDGHVAGTREGAPAWQGAALVYSKCLINAESKTKMEYTR